MTRKKKTLIALLILLLLGGATYYLLNRPNETPRAATVQTPPKLKGSVLELPNTAPDGSKRCAPEYNGSVVRDGFATKKYKPGACERVGILEIPINGACPIAPGTGVIGAPSNWLEGCSYKHKEGGVAYLGHSVRGPAVGAFERISELQVGQKVKVDGRVYTVASVGRFPADNLPSRLWQKGHFSLITCYISAQADAGGPILADDVVELTD